MNQELPFPARGRLAGEVGIVGVPQQLGPIPPRKEVARALLGADACRPASPAFLLKLVPVAMGRVRSFAKEPARRTRIPRVSQKSCWFRSFNFGYSYNKRLWNHRTLLHLARCSFPTPKSPPLGFASVQEVPHPALTKGHGILLGSCKSLVRAEVTTLPAAFEVLVLPGINRPRAAA